MGHIVRGLLPHKIREVPTNLPTGPLGPLGLIHPVADPNNLTIGWILANSMSC
jgi:hypothetical protein